MYLMYHMYLMFRDSNHSNTVQLITCYYPGVQLRRTFAALIMKLRDHSSITTHNKKGHSSITDPTRAK